MWEVSTTDIDLEKVDFAAMARAYKIIYFYAAGKSRIIDLMFRADDDEELEEWNPVEGAEISTDLKAQYESWFLSNMERPELRMACLMISGESRNRITYDAILNRILRVPEEECTPPEKWEKMHKRLMERITAQEAVTGNEKQRKEKVYDGYG